MRRVAGTVAILILLGTLGTGCAKRPGPGAEGAAASSAPFTNQELLDELRRQGLGAASGQGAAGFPEITETARGIVITLPSTFFAFDRSELDPQALGVVDRIAQVMNHPRATTRKISLEGHTDNVGAADYNMALSKRRVDAVAAELVKQGMQADRIATQAFGETRPVAPNRNPDGTDNPVGRAKNRRVEAVIPNYNN
jgi:outer membrane protein OmpA-like peptidoglycan-associated protein